MELDIKQPKARFRFGGTLSHFGAVNRSSSEQRAISNNARQKQFKQNYRRIDAVRDELRRQYSVR